MRHSLDGCSLTCLLIIGTAIVLQALGSASVVVPSTNCYVLNNSSHIVDFVSCSAVDSNSSWVGHAFEYEGKYTDLVVRFCKDVESRSQTGYVNFGRFDFLNYFVAGSGQVDFVQGFLNGDLMNCEQSYDKMGRTAQVNINTPKVKVYNGMTQWGFEKSHRDFSFRTEQAHVALYMTAITSLSKLVGKPIIKVLPENGLDIRLSGSGAAGTPPTTLSPTVLIVDWRCEKASDGPYQVNVTIPVEGFEPIQFILTKMCEYRQVQGQDATRGWATFGVLSCIFIVFSTLACAGGFIYRTRVGHLRGIDALPGMTILSACLETTKFDIMWVKSCLRDIDIFHEGNSVISLVSGAGQSYSRAEDLNSAFTRTSWERPPVPAQGTGRPSEKKYGSI
ncbi:hypothetical protein CJ030_MR8G004541 [Morella rubra]|uniref:Uncharacterized protein n=1 Tax=Morella rubra TaxID=262757 RepID=A0A6A1UQ64_9ROSI|nr:hypothetical protein CJ030_MR8G004541 [Morella rubra]